MYTYNISIKQDTELSIVDAHILWNSLVPQVEIFLFISAKFRLVGRNSASKHEQSTERPLHWSILEI